MLTHDVVDSNRAVYRAVVECVIFGVVVDVGVVAQEEEERHSEGEKDDDQHQQEVLDVLDDCDKHVDEVGCFFEAAHEEEDLEPGEQERLRAQNVELVGGVRRRYPQVRGIQADQRERDETKRAADQIDQVESAVGAREVVPAILPHLLVLVMEQNDVVNRVVSPRSPNELHLRLVLPRTLVFILWVL